MKVNLLDQFKLLLQRDPAPVPEDRQHRARTALLLAILEADYREQDAEHRVLREVLQRRTAVSDDEAVALIASAKAQLSDSASLYEFTETLQKSLSPDQRRELMEDLWSVAFADGEIDPQEEHLMRRLADLLAVPHRVYIQSKLKAPRR